MQPLSSNTPPKVTPKDFILDSLEPLIRRNVSKVDYPQLRIDETGIDSLELMELVMTVEDKFGIQIDDGMITNNITIAEFCRQAEELFSASR